MAADREKQSRARKNRDFEGIGISRVEILHCLNRVARDPLTTTVPAATLFCVHTLQSHLNFV